MKRDLRLDSARWVKRTRSALPKEPDRLSEAQLEVLYELRRRGSVLYRWQLKEGLRDLFRLADPAQAARHLDWCGLGLPLSDPRPLSLCPRR